MAATHVNIVVHYTRPQVVHIGRPWVVHIARPHLVQTTRPSLVQYSPASDISSLRKTLYFLSHHLPFLPILAASTGLQLDHYALMLS